MNRRGLLYTLGSGASAATAITLLTGALAISPAHATTGNADGLPEPKILVNPAIGDYYIGRFYLTRISRSAHIESAVFDIDYTESVEHEFIVGDGQIYQYNSKGELTSFTTSLYPFVYKHGLMSFNLLVPGTINQVVGKVVENRPKNLDTESHPNRETITAKLTLGKHTYNATFQQVEDDLPAPSKLPAAVQTG